MRNDRRVVNLATLALAALGVGLLFASSAAAVPISDFANVGGGTLNIVASTGSVASFGLTQTFGNTVILDFTSVGYGAIGGLRIVTSGGVVNVPDYIAASASTWSDSTVSGGDAWWSTANAITYHNGRYEIGQLVDASYPGGVNADFITAGAAGPYIVYAYLNTAATITGIDMGTGTNANASETFTAYVGDMNGLINLSYNSSTGLSAEGLATIGPGTGSTSYSEALQNGQPISAAPEPGALLLVGATLIAGMARRTSRTADART